MRKISGINFKWLFTRKKAGVSIANHDEATMEVVDIPHNNTDLPFNNFDEDLFEFKSVYKKHIYINLKKDNRYFIKFDGVAHKADIYINNKFVSCHENGYTGFTVDISEFVKDGDNLIALEVDSSKNLNQPPFGKTIDFLTYSGIYREVYLIETPYNYIEDVFIKTEDLLKNPKILLDVKISGGKELEVLIKDEDNEVFFNKYQAHEKIEIKYPFDLWSIDNPKLYNIEIILDKNDTFNIETGFRDIDFRKDGFYLNDKKIKIRGLNRHQIYPYVGYAMPKNVQIKDAEILKELGNAVRTSHYPQSKHFLKACDELGLLVFIEAPGWQYIGDEEWKENYLKSVKEMIINNKYHPSIFLWGVRVNESGDDSKLYLKSNEIAHKLDDRATGGVRCISFSEELEDVYTYNDFFYNGKNKYTKNIDEIITSDKPYLITEFNGHMFPTKTIDNSERLIEHALRYARVVNEIEGNDRTAGGFGWQFIDYHTNKQFGSGDGICYHGVCDIFRIKKPAAKFYQSQLEKSAYLEILNSSDIGDYNCGFIDAFYIASNCDYIDLYQNDRYVSRYYPRKDLFQNLEHPLYIIDDWFGDDFIKEGYSKEEGDKIKKIAIEIARRGGLDKVTKEDYFYGDLAKEAWKLYGKYVANWGSKSFIYRFVGNYKGQETTKYIGPYKTYSYDIKPDIQNLLISETYDSTRVVIKAIDDLGNLRKYCFDSFKLSAKGSIEIIGDDIVSLIGGQRAIWVKTKNPGKGYLTFENNRYRKTIEFDVKIIK